MAETPNRIVIVEYFPLPDNRLGYQVKIVMNDDTNGSEVGFGTIF
jgi:hypothetical protein